jgi:hypothetical protein
MLRQIRRLTPRPHPLQRSRVTILDQDQMVFEAVFAKEGEIFLVWAGYRCCTG